MTLRIHDIFIFGEENVMTPNKKVFFTFLSFVLIMLVIACSCYPYPPEPPPLTLIPPNPMPGLAGTWNAPDTGEVFEIAWQGGLYVVVSCTWNGLSYSITSQYWTGSSLTWSYYDQAISLTVTVTTTSLNGDSLDVNVSISDGSSGTVTLLRGGLSTVTPFLDVTVSAQPQVITPIMPASETSILTDVLQEFDGRCISSAGVVTKDNTYSFSCYNSADTYYTVSITRFNSEATAQAQFESSRGDNPTLCFHGYDLYETYSTGAGNQFIANEQLGWQVGQWVVSIDALYDYGYFHFTTRDFSEAVYTSSVEHDLFPAGTCP
jgi:hypothetical protein